MEITKDQLDKIDELDRLVVVALGDRNSGKSSTWNVIFDKGINPGRHGVRTSKKTRRLSLSGSSPEVFLVNGSAEERGIPVGRIVVKQWTEVFLVTGSPEERRKKVSEIIEGFPRIVLVSIQDIQSAKESFQFFIDNGYFFFIHWLNPGYRQQEKDNDVVQELLSRIPKNHFIFDTKDGNDPIDNRVDEMRDFIAFWAGRKEAER